MMAEYIEREATCKECVRYGMGETLCADCVVKVAPVADVVLVVHGRWVDKKAWHMGRWVAWKECSRCGEKDENCEMYEMLPFGGGLPNYCPNCGARMDGE